MNVFVTTSSTSLVLDLLKVLELELYSVPGNWVLCFFFFLKDCLLFLRRCMKLLLALDPGLDTGQYFAMV